MEGNPADLETRRSAREHWKGIRCGSMDRAGFGMRQKGPLSGMEN